MISFKAVDVETANTDSASICQIGIASVQDGNVTDQWKSLVNPEKQFDPWNTRIHGITEDDVRDSPTLAEIRSELSVRLHGSVVVSHTGFDRIAFDRAMAKNRLEQLQVTWLDSAKIARRAWPDRYARRGYGLKSVAQDLGIPFRHHDALEDARAAAEIVIHACAATGLDIDGWLHRADRPINERPVRRKRGAPVRRAGRSEGPLRGETVLFSGRLGILRSLAARLAAEAGCNVAPGVSRDVTMLVLGGQEERPLNERAKSGKHRMVEALIANGAHIRIATEAEFFEFLGIDRDSVLRS